MISKLEQQITVLAQPRQLETVGRRLKVLNSELDRLSELKSGRKDASNTLGFSMSGPPGVLPGGSQPATGAPDGQNQEGGGLSNDAEEKVQRTAAYRETKSDTTRLTTCSQRWRKLILY